MSAHTPGPWRLIPRGEPTPGPMYRGLIALVANEPALYVVLDDGHPLDRVPPEQWEANARLIAAAPDMYAALSVAAENLCLAGPDHDGMDSPSCGDSLCTGCIARAALKKAAP